MIKKDSDYHKMIITIFFLFYDIPLTRQNLLHCHSMVIHMKKANCFNAVTGKVPLQLA